MNRETWKPIQGLEGRYEVSDRGRVRSVGITVTLKKTYPPRILAQASRGGKKRKTKSMAVSVYNGREKRIVSVHKLVAEAFLGPALQGKEVCHNDGNPENNAVENLRYDTHRNNIADKIRHGTMMAGEKHYAAKLTAKQVEKARKLHGQGTPVLQLSKQFGVSNTHMKRIISGESWAHPNTSQNMRSH